MYDFEEIVCHGCCLCNRKTEWYNEVCNPCMEYFYELANSFKFEDNEDDNNIEIEEKYNTDDYDIIFFQRKRSYTI